VISSNRIASFLVADARAERPLSIPWRLAHATRRRILPGSRVQVRSGVFSGVRGTVTSYSSVSRLTIDVELNCQGVSLEIDEQLVEPIRP
jgi:hypothetical protein